MTSIRNLSVFLFFIFSCSTLLSQKTAIYVDKDALYKQGLELFDKKQYVNAQKNFTEYISSASSSLLKTDAQYYSSACAIELFNKDGEWLMKQFIEQHPGDQKINQAHFYLGKSNFRKKKYSETLEFLQKVDIYKLDKDQLAELYFKRGYSYYETGNNEKAKADLYEIKDIDNRYANPANYYYSHISYKEKNYETAMAGFKRLVGNETFGTVVPYYITQIYFIQGKYEIVTKEAPELLNDSNHVQKADEINRMIGESYFNLKDYNNALTFLKKTNMGSNPAGNYALGYCYYKTGDCKEAVSHFEKATEAKDSLSQNAWYHMADCYIKTGAKLQAKNAYYGAYQTNFDKKITEDALFAFAKLSYELDFSPYNEAVKAFTKYLKEYPTSPRKDEVYNFLINVYSTTKNYDLAIKSMESMESIDPILKVTYQKLIYFRGVEYFNNSDFANAEKQFKKSLNQNSDLKLNALSQYWLGEVNYNRKDYTTAIENWKKFQVMDGTLQLKEYDLSNYAIGYAYFQRKERDKDNKNGDDYANANISFRKFLLSKNKEDENKVIDAQIRTADCYFMNNDFIQAGEYYSKAIEANKMDVDYSLYQKALCDGLNRKYNEKITELKKIESRYPASNYMSASLNEIADTYYNNLKDEENAIVYYNRILKNYPHSSFTPNCYAQLGNIFYGRKQDDKAFEYYDKFVKMDSKSDAAKEVLEAIKKIFTEKGKIEEMEKYFAAIGNPLSENELEKTTYLAAYKAYYEEKNCDVALLQWQGYISKFPNGKHISEAEFNSAECNYSKSNFEKALTGYLYVIGKERGLYSEVAYAKAAYIYYKDKKYAEALPLFQQLQDIAETPSNKSAGRFGAMRSAFYLNQFETALTECTKVLSTEKLSPQQLSEAKYIKAKSLYETNRLDDAMIEFKAITKTAKNITGAEAYYHIAMIQFKKQDYKEVEKTINKLISYEYSNDDWNNKGMILLADQYLAKGDEADAQVILETIIDSKPKQEYVDEAKKRLDALKAKQNNQQASPQNKDMKVDFNQSKKDGDLFDKMYKEYEQNKSAPTNTTVEQPK
ncbi:MAG: tetratricopeptide repeat protein [Bacteroidetes bacterium]|nr:tetratricopeptide repeat protein [Bacteroidota bacterium]